MSCIAGLLDLDASPVDVDAVRAMAAVMETRAPDGRQTYCQGSVAFAQCFLLTGSSGAERPNPLTLDGSVYITADARIDDRARLLGELRERDLAVEEDASHAELILHAYAAFGDTFLDHLLGDFAFAIWDSGRRRLICARDHFGIRPLYWCRNGSQIAFASDLDALRTLPWLSSQLDPLSVSDFLMFGTCTEPQATMFRDIRRLPAGMRMDVRGHEVELARYWHLPVRETRYRKPAEYVDHFEQLFTQAVRDRMPQAPVAIQLSGGMDSTSIAAIAAAHDPRHGTGITAFNISTRQLSGQDPEESLAQLVAGHLRIDFVTQDLGAYPLHGRALDPEMSTPVPYGSPQLALHLDTLSQMRARDSRVMLSGFAADALFRPSSDYCAELARDHRWLKLARELAHHASHAGTLRGLGLRRAFLTSAPAPKPPWRPELLSWLSNHWSERFSLLERWEKWWQTYRAATDATGQLSVPWLDRSFEVGECLPAPVVIRYPFLDVRLAQYLLSVPNWMLDAKKILRRAMAARLPSAITTRPKAPLIGDPVREQYLAGNIMKHNLPLGPAIDAEAYATALEQFRGGAGSETTWMSSLLFLPDSLAHWIAHAGAIYE